MHEDTHARELEARRPLLILTLTPPLTLSLTLTPTLALTLTLTLTLPLPPSRPDGHFPVSHTCFFSLEWPRYSSTEVAGYHPLVVCATSMLPGYHPHQVARAKLLYAIANCTDMDMDQTTEGLANMAMVTTGDDDE